MAARSENSSVDSVKKDTAIGGSISATVVRKKRIKEGMFLAAVAGFSILGGFGMTFALAKKKDPSMFVKGLLPTHQLPESGGNLALRALGWGSLYAVTGVGSFCFIVWKLLGVNDLGEFRQRMGQVLPKVPKHQSEGRTDFESIRDLLEYVIEEDKKKSSKGS